MVKNTGSYRFSGWNHGVLATRLDEKTVSGKETLELVR